jgi:ankyrin repeat protein
MADLRLHEAAVAGDVDAIRRLAAAGVDLDARDDAGRTPVMAATIARQTEAVRELLDAGADVDIRDTRLDNPFLYAGAEGLLDILRVANEAGADPAITNRFGGIALIPASERGHVEVVRYLLEESDVDVDHMNNLGWTALLEAVILGNGGPDHQAIVGMLVDAGADPELADRDSVTPLAHARARGQDEVAAILVDAGAER